MSYTNTKTKRGQVLDALVDLMGDIQQSNGSFFDVKRVHLFSGWQLAFGTKFPAIAVVVTNEERIEALACAADRYEMTVTIVGALTIPNRDASWADETQRLIGDIQTQINGDRQLGGLADYIEVNATDVAEIDTEGQGNMALGSVTCSVLYRVAVDDITT